MKTHLKRIMLALLLVSGANAAMFQSVAPEKAQLLQSGEGRHYCPNCGMNLVKFFKTSHAMKQKEGMIHQYCSIHCLAEANDVITPDTKVVDVGSLKFIDAFGATYVVGSTMPGTMTMNSKYAFASKAQAEAFAGKNGGTLMTFAEAVQLAADDIANDNVMIEKKRKMAAKKGKMMFEKMCDKEARLPSFGSIAAAKTHLLHSGVCGELDDSQYQAMAIYLARSASMDSEASAIAVPRNAKCPVCGMFVSKYPKWAATIQIDGYTHYYDGVKDMMKFYFVPSAYHKQATREMITSMTVTDYYSLKAVDAKVAWYVIGSNVFGPMGHELIPFADKKEALSFKRDHFGKQVLSFEQISPGLLESIDR